MGAQASHLGSRLEVLVPTAFVQSCILNRRFETMGAGSSAAQNKKEAILTAFKALDKDGDGKMTKDEVKEFLQKEDKEVFTDELCDALYNDANPDGDGAI